MASDRTLNGIHVSNHPDRYIEDMLLVTRPTGAAVVLHQLMLPDDTMIGEPGGGALAPTNSPFIALVHSPSRGPPPHCVTRLAASGSDSPLASHVTTTRARLPTSRVSARDWSVV